MKFLIGFLSNFALIFGQVCVWYSAINSKINIKSKKFYIKLLCFDISMMLIHYFAYSHIKGPLLLVISIVFCKIFTNKSIKESVILGFISQLSIIIIEALLLVTLTFIFSINLENIATTEFISIFFDISISLVLFLLSKITIYNKLYNCIRNITKNIKVYKIFIFLLFVVFAIGIFCSTIYFKSNITLVVILNVIISIVYTVIILLIFRYQSKLSIITEKYRITLDSLQSQEQLINDYRIINHENKNNLRTIKTMTNNKRIIGYIDSLIKEKSYLNTKVINDSIDLPSIGIRAIIYNKLIVMNENKIKYVLNVDKKIDKRDLINLSDDDIVDICQILGVFLDNAIEETMKYKKEKITINLFSENDTIQINIGNINKQNFMYNENKKISSSKNKNRGHGLQLVKRIIDKNEKLNNKVVITKDTVIQQLIIEIKKD